MANISLPYHTVPDEIYIFGSPYSVYSVELSILFTGFPSNSRLFSSCFVEGGKVPREGISNVSHSSLFTVNKQNTKTHI